MTARDYDRVVLAAVVSTAIITSSGSAQAAARGRAGEPALEDAGGPGVGRCGVDRRDVPLVREVGLQRVPETVRM